MKPPRFSIVIPARSRSKDLDDCLAALDGQRPGRSDFEVIVVFDRAPGGRGCEGMGGFSFDVRCERLAGGAGAAAARNRGVELSRGEVVLFLDDDSVPPRHWLAGVCRFWDEPGGFDGMGGHVTSAADDGILSRVNSEMFNWYYDSFSGASGTTFLSTCNAGFLRKALMKVGGFDESFPEAGGEDGDVCYRMVASGGRLRLLEGVEVYHDRRITALDFARKHFNYGKAARRLATLHPGLRGLRAKDYLGLYLRVMSRYRGVERAAAVMLVTASQAATAAGYLHARCRSIGRRAG